MFRPKPQRIRVPNFTPRWYQVAPCAYLDNGGSRVITVWHRRAGKDLDAAHYACKRAHEDVGVYYHLFPSTELGRKALWTAIQSNGKQIMEEVFPRAIRSHPPKDFGSGAEMVVRLRNGSVYRIIGTDHIDNVGAGPLGLIFSEYSLMRPTVWDFFRPMLREPGPSGRPRWAWFNFTPRGPNHAKDLYDRAEPGSGWFRDLKTVRDTRLQYVSSRTPGKLIDCEELMAEELAEGMPEDMVRQEYLCDFSAADVGAVYGAAMGEMERRGGVKDFEHPRDGINVSLDLGRDDATAMWFWRAMPEGVDFIDYYEKSGETLPHFTELLQERAKERGYRYQTVWLPHDARAKTFASSMTAEEGFRAAGQEPGAVGYQVRITPNISRQDGMRACRWLIQQPGTRFHATRCKDGLRALRHYHREWDADRKVFTTEPVHDWSSHGADAGRYVGVAYKIVLRRQPEVAAPPRPLVTSPGVSTYTMEDAWGCTSDPRRERI